MGLLQDFEKDIAFCYLNKEKNLEHVILYEIKEAAAYLYNKGYVIDDNTIATIAENFILKRREQQQFLLDKATECGSDYWKPLEQIISDCKFNIALVGDDYYLDIFKSIIVNLQKEIDILIKYVPKRLYDKNKTMIIRKVNYDGSAEKDFYPSFVKLWSHDKSEAVIVREISGISEELDFYSPSFVNITSEINSFITKLYLDYRLRIINREKKNGIAPPKNIASFLSKTKDDFESLNIDIHLRHILIRYNSKTFNDIINNSIDLDFFDEKLKYNYNEDEIKVRKLQKLLPCGYL